MNFSKTTEYSLRILSFMAVNETKLYNAEILCSCLEIPYRYLRKQLTKLTKSGLLVSLQGKNGGYKMSRPSEKISLWDIVVATEGVENQHECLLGFEDCVFGASCSLREKWKTVQDSINEMLKDTTLAELRESGSHKFILHHNNLLLTKNV
jgi:Rrf2 family protein